ncbi:MAG: thioredoxin [Oscillospiraceae bacterium]|nr:thioredoxin [Oscillospiraceae bacterium]
MSVKELSAAEFADAVKSGTVLVDFWATWCGPCKMMLPVFDQVAAEVGDTVKTFKFNIEESAEAAAGQGVSIVPTFILYKDGVKVASLTGPQSKTKLLDLAKKA